MKLNHVASQTIIEMKELQNYLDTELQQRKVLKLRFLREGILKDDSTSKYYTGM